LKYFFGKVNFIIKVIYRFTKIVNPLNVMLKQDAIIEWTPLVKVVFHDIKTVIMQALVLVSPKFNKYLYIYSFALDHTIEIFLTQKGKINECPIAFMSTNLKETELKYSILKK